ncbi:MAG: hypothetical protein FD183_1337 [Chitinophagaceae bacterium]|nr:MAG: hypothetical protein FD183_1337 [Chitinophagaceae bacterium]
MKTEITVKIKNDDRTETIKPLTIDIDIPEFDEFKGPDNIREVFYKYEKAVLKVGNAAAEISTEEYFTELSEKEVSGTLEYGYEGA